MYIASQDAHASYTTWRRSLCARPPIARSATSFARNVRIIAISAASASCDLAIWRLALSTTFSGGSFKMLKVSHFQALERCTCIYDHKTNISSVGSAQYMQS